MSKRLLLIIVGSFVLAFAAPVGAGAVAMAIAAVFVTGSLLGLVAHRALHRRDELSEAIALELNKLRRVYHLGKNLAVETRHRAWFTDLHTHLYAYLMAFDKKPFSQYQETNGQFRKLSYHLYQIDGLESEKERVLYRDLLEAAGTVATSRQRIQEIWNGRLPSSLRNTLVLMAALSATAVLMAMGPADRWTSALLLSVLGSALAFTFQADNLPVLVGEDVSKRYVENIARLELAREE